MQKLNYRIMMENRISDLKEEGRIGSDAPALLLHSCCGPCSSAVIETLSACFKITVFYFNPNIDEKSEYDKRAAEQRRLIEEMPTINTVRFVDALYTPQDFIDAVKNHEGDTEGGPRCTLCYALRLEKTAKAGAEGAYAFFTTTLSVSPMKDADRINNIGNSLAEKYHVEWLWSDFKKKDGYKKSIELSKKYNLYRQDYCGCAFSRRDQN